MPNDEFIQQLAALALVAVHATAILVASHAARQLSGVRARAVAWAAAASRR